MSYPNNPHKWGILIFYFIICTHSTRDLFYLPKKSNKNLNFRCYNSSSSNSYCFPRVRPPLRADIILRSYCNHRNPFSHSNFRNRNHQLNLRWTFRRKSYSYALFFPSFYFTYRNLRSDNHPHYNITHKRLF